MNPEHLFLGTPADNTDDMLRKDRGPKGPLSKRDIRAIKYLYATGKVGPSVLARAFDVSITSMNRLTKNVSWRYVLLANDANSNQQPVTAQ